MKKLFLFPIGILLGLFGGFFFGLHYVQAFSSVTERLKGRIILQVESRGEAWYLHPKTRLRHYLGRPNDAFVLMRSFGVGIRDSDLAKIPVADVNLFQATYTQDSDQDYLSDDVEISLGTDPQRADTDQDGYSDKEEILDGFDPLKRDGARLPLDARFAKGRAGIIFLQVEKNGEAWYINPTDQKRYYLGRPLDAFEVMKKTGLGILNKDLETIPVDVVVRSYVPLQATPPLAVPLEHEKNQKQSEFPPSQTPLSLQQEAIKFAPQTPPVVVRVTVPTLSTIDLRPGMERVRIASFQIDSEASERVVIDELVFSDQLFTRTNAALFSQETIVINMKDTPLIRKGSILTTRKRDGPIAVLVKNGSITIDVVGDILPIIPARLHDVLPKADEHLSIVHIEARGEISGKTAIVTPFRSELTPLRFISVVDESKLRCTVGAESFKQTGTIQCGRIMWELTPQTASGFLGDPRPFLMKYDTLYQFYKDFMGGSEPSGGKITIRENPSNPYPADVNWQNSIIRTNTAFAKDHFVYLGNHDLQPYAPSFMHELGHIFGLTSPQKNAFIWKDFVEGNANLIGILPYLMAYDGTFTMGVDFWCRNKLKVVWPCDGTFSDFEMYPEWLGANKDLQEYEREKETFATLFINPPADQNVYERGGKFMTMLTTLYTEWKKQGMASKFWDAYRKTQQFYFKNSDILPYRWKNTDESFDLPADTIFKMNTYLLLLSAYANADILSVFESRWHFPILQKTKNAYARIQIAGFSESFVLKEMEKIFPQRISTQPVLESSGLSAHYFPNHTLSGPPVLTRIDRDIDFIWDLSAPFSGVPENRFSARWEGKITPTTSGVITFSAIADDGVRLWVNNQLVFEEWTMHAPKLSSGSIVLEQDRSYPIKIEYYDDWWGAGIRLAWSSATLPEEVIPESAFSH